MARITLIHWNEDEAHGRIARLEKANHDVAWYGNEQGGASLKRLGTKPPDAIVIDLTRLPSHGRACATFLRQQTKTRMIPIVFVCDDEAKIARARKELPDAAFTDWRKIRGTITRALKKKSSRDPLVPDTMAGYSGTPLPKKLGLKPNTTLMLLDAPRDFESTLGAIPEGVTIKRTARGQAELVMLFVTKMSNFRRRLPTAERAIAEGGGLWIAWPKKASGVATDVTQNDVRRAGLDDGLVDYKICAIDATWSGLKFSWRKT